ncbi:MAG: helix-turn-helix domain-containing protein [Atribacterota bacterium]|jgi:transcriptional regulator with XRE-family HTH domain|nr:helix-turn-helix domain-containing protein [Atribacterota bacterium]
MSEEKILGIGNLLKSNREKLGLSLDDVEQQTFIHKRYLRAIEEERWESLPGFSHAFGYVKNYGRVLNLDQETLKSVFQQSYPNLPKKEPSPRSKYRDYTPEKADLFKKILLFLIIAAAILTSLYLSIEFRKNRVDAGDTFLITEVTEQPELTPSLVESSPELTPALVQVSTPTPTPEYLLRVNLQTEDVAWLQVTTNDNQKVFSGILIPQKEYRFLSNSPLIMSCLNGSKVRVLLNGTEAGFLAENDQRSERTFRP